MLLEVGRLPDFGLLEDLSLNGVWCELDIETPLLDILTLGDHLIELLDRMDPIMRLLEQALAHLSDCLLVFPHLLWDSDQHGEFRRQINVLTLLLDLKQGLLHFKDLFIVLLLEVGGH